MDDSQKIYFMSFALQEAKIAFKKNEVPIGCVVVSEDKIVGRGHNQVISNKSINHHAEIVALNAGFVGSVITPELLTAIALVPPVCAIFCTFNVDAIFTLS